MDLRRSKRGRQSRHLEDHVKLAGDKEGAKVRSPSSEQKD